MELNKQAFTDFIKTAQQYIGDKSKEDIIRQNFTLHLKSMFLEQPNWINAHVAGGESAIPLNRKGKETTGFIDSLIGLTPIEYEKNLQIQPIFDKGYQQVKEYCTQLINQGHPNDLIIGILSDTIRWYAYEVEILNERSPLSVDDVALKQIDFVEVGQFNNDYVMLGVFLQKYLGRLGSRPLTANSIKNDFGFDSLYSEEYRQEMDEVIRFAYDTQPEYAVLIEKLWGQFVNLSRKKDDIMSQYSDEFYLLTLSKFVCVNILEKKSLLSSPKEIAEIISGEYFVRSGLSNLVEYDFFGWINYNPQFVEKIIPIVQKIQIDLQVYDFVNPGKEDIFGSMFAQLAVKSKRIILGQEMTPHWLAEKMAKNLFEKLPSDENPQFLDMCCGSGVMLVEVLQKTIQKIETDRKLISDDEKLRYLSDSITGFDIDPLAVFLSKVNWVIVAQPILSKNIGKKIEIPVYNADSLFSVTPLNKVQDKVEIFELSIANRTLKMPTFILNQPYSYIFDFLIDKCQLLAHSNVIRKSMWEKQSEVVISQAEGIMQILIPDEEKKILKEFILNLIEILYDVNERHLNGIWAFILKNSYRPGLMRRRFNGLISNPPWLTMSKIGHNPYTNDLKVKANKFGIMPKGSSALHMELATVFLLEGVSEYLTEKSVIACILPESILKGQNHNPFRNEAYLESIKPVGLKIDEIWKTPSGIFSNLSVVLIGSKKNPMHVKPNEEFVGKEVHEENEDKEFIFYKNYLGEKTSWDWKNISQKKDVTKVARFQQGADIMERALFFYDIKLIDENTNHVKSISSKGSLSFLRSDFKKYIDMHVSQCCINSDLIYPVIISKLLTPFSMAPPIPAVLPIKIEEVLGYQPLTEAEIIMREDDYPYIKKTIEQEGVRYPDLWKKLNMRNKLTNQSTLLNTVDKGYLILTGTSGSNVCAAFVEKYSEFAPIIDQTLNWYYTTNEDEAIYITGLMNCNTINEIIKAFQTSGLQGERHIHNLPYEVTPIYDSENRNHRDVVNKTKKLIVEFRTLLEKDKDIQSLLFPMRGTLQFRRKQIKKQIEKLDSYAEYEEVCARIYSNT